MTDKGSCVRRQDMPGLAVGDAVLIHQTQRETMIICQPQQRNTAGRMFGGYLMRCKHAPSHLCLVGGVSTYAGITRR